MINKKLSNIALLESVKSEAPRCYKLVQFIKAIHYGVNDIALYSVLLNLLNNEKQSLSIIKLLFKHCISTQKYDELVKLLTHIHTHIAKYNVDNLKNIHDIINSLYNHYPHILEIQILLIKSLIDNDEKDIAKQIIDATFGVTKLHLQCIYALNTKNDIICLKAIDALIDSSQFPSLLLNIICNIDLNHQNIQEINNIIRKIVMQPNYTIYLRAINKYIRRLFDLQSIEEAKIVKTFISKADIELFLEADMLMMEQKNQELFDLICSNLEKISSFFPLLKWLMDASIQLNNIDELLNILRNYPKQNKAHIQCIDSILEYKKEISNRTYKILDPMALDSEVAVLYCTNSKYFIGFKASIVSFIVNNKHLLGDIHFHICIDNTLDHNEMFEFLKNLPINFTISDIESIQDTNNLKIDYGIRSYFKLDRSAYYRIYMINRLINEKKYAKILYLDSDVLILSSLYDLFALDMNKPLMATLESESELAIIESKKINNISQYFNSGVLLINSSHNETAKCVAKAMGAIDEQDKLILHDQCALNIGFNNNFVSLDKKYNFLIHQNKFNIYEPEIDILHLSGRSKPWEPMYHENEYISKLWFSYYKMSFFLKAPL